MTAVRTIAPGGTIGVLGGGQLGRMLAMAAAELGYHTHIYAPDRAPPAGDCAAQVTRAAYDDGAALDRFAAAVDVVTYEFENVPVASAERLAARTPVFPPPAALGHAQDRCSEKDFVRGLGGTPAPYARVDDLEGLRAALRELGTPAILKTRRMGYDGKGQARIADPADAEQAWAAVGGEPSILEAHVGFEAEFSILLVRGQDGHAVCYPAAENVHHDGILARSTSPGTGLVHDQAPAAARLVGKVADALDYVGLLACEFFATADGPVFNEMAPRVHNSGHWTIEGAVASQFENHVRAICGLPLGLTSLTGTRVEMENLIGAAANDWPRLLAEPGLHLHLYGKGEARPGRKMGHATRVLRGV